MTDAEKVFEALDLCIKQTVNDEDKCEQCPYYYEKDCVSELLRHAQKVLKEYKIPSTLPVVCPDASATTWRYACFNCNNPLDYHDKYCRKCGKQVLWDD